MIVSLMVIIILFFSTVDLHLFLRYLIIVMFILRIYINCGVSYYVLLLLLFQNIIPGV